MNDLNNNDFMMTIFISALSLPRPSIQLDSDSITTSETIIAISTFDNLAVISDEFVKNDQSFESVTMRIVDILCSLLKGDTDQVEANLMVNDTDKSLSAIPEKLKEVSLCCIFMCTKSAHYNQIKENLQRKFCSLLFVKKEHFVLDSEYLESNTFVDVEWYSKYETITQMIVLQSSQKIAEDNEMANHHKEFWEVGATEKELWTSLLRLATMNFGEVFVSWVHLKILRVYVESVLHYGLPPDFMSVIIKKIREILNTQYGKYGGSLGNESSKVENIEEFHNLVDKDYYPYVCGFKFILIFQKDTFNLLCLCIFILII
ncbi:3219_t:CDS:10 [Entrophospora sp. SA101]|nr:3219_t:CDS:10 [Entrophospora sp. SA101]